MNQKQEAPLSEAEQIQESPDSDKQHPENREPNSSPPASEACAGKDTPPSNDNSSMTGPQEPAANQPASDRSSNGSADSSADSPTVEEDSGAGAKPEPESKPAAAKSESEPTAAAKPEPEPEPKPAAAKPEPKAPVAKAEEVPAEPEPQQVRSEADVRAALAAWSGSEVDGITPEQARRRGFEPPPEAPATRPEATNQKPQRSKPRSAPKRPAPEPGPEETGRIRWFDVEKGYGFIRPEKGGEDVFVHINQFSERPDQVDQGAKVSYRVGQGRKGKDEAKTVQVL